MRPLRPGDRWSADPLRTVSTNNGVATKAPASTTPAGVKVSCTPNHWWSGSPTRPLRPNAPTAPPAHHPGGSTIGSSRHQTPDDGSTRERPTGEHPRQRQTDAGGRALSAAIELTSVSRIAARRLVVGQGARQGRPVDPTQEPQHPAMRPPRTTPQPARATNGPVLLSCARPPARRRSEPSWSPESLGPQHALCPRSERHEIARTQRQAPERCAARRSGTGPTCPRVLTAIHLDAVVRCLRGVE